MKKIFLKVILFSVIVEVFLVCLFIMIGNYDSINWRLFLFVFSIIACSFPCLFYSKLYESDNPVYKKISLCGFAAAFVEFLLVECIILEVIPYSEVLSKFSLSVGDVMIWLGFMSWILLITSTNKMINILKKVCMIFVVILGVFYLTFIWIDFSGEIFLKLSSILSVLAYGCFFILIIFLIFDNKFQENSSIESDDSDSKVLSDKKKKLDEDSVSKKKKISSTDKED